MDASIATSSSPLGLHALSSSSTLFLSGSDLLKYLHSIETADVKLQELDLQILDAAAPAPSTTSKALAKEKEDAKIEGAVKIAIGVKKEVDFPTWYTNVCVFPSCSGREIFTRINIGPDQSGHVGLLQRLWLLHPEIEPWSYSIWEEVQSKLYVPLPGLVLTLLLHRMCSKLLLSHVCVRQGPRARGCMGNESVFLLTFSYFSMETRTWRSPSLFVRPLRV